MIPGHESKIQELLNQKRFTEAENMLRRRLIEDPQNSDAYYLLGVSAYFQGQVPSTIQNLRKSLELDPKHTDAAICLSVLLNDLGKYDDAKRVFDQANHGVVHRTEGTISSIDQKFAVKHLEMGDLYFRYRRYDEAIDEYTKSILLNPLHLDARIRRSKSYARKGFVSRALQDLQALKHERPEYVPARVQLGLLYYSQGNVMDAEIEWEGALEMQPTNREAASYLEMAKQSRLNFNVHSSPHTNARPMFSPPSEGSHSTV